MKNFSYIIIFSFFALLIFSCNGSKKYFKAAEKLEKQGLVKEAAEYYLESLQRKPTSVEAKIKLKEVGQKHVSTMASEFFRNYNTQQIESSLESFENLKAFNARAAAVSVQFDYPKAYEEDYQKAVETYCAKNYNQAALLVSQKKYYEAVSFLNKVEKYNPSYRNTKQLEIIATCEPLYQSAINNLENKNYSGALTLINNIRVKSEDYKDTKDLYELASTQQSRSFILFEPHQGSARNEHDLKQLLYNKFSEVSHQKLNTVKIINNSPFQNAPSANDLYNSTNYDLIQAIRKATGADFFYVFDVTNAKEFTSGLSKTPARAFQEVNTRVNDTTVVTEYKPVEYNIVRASRTYSYDFKYKLINAYTNQVISSQSQTIRSNDAIEYNEFARKFTGNINMLFPYNPSQTGTGLPIRQNAKAWRNQFSARNTLKSFDELKSSVFDQNVNIFTNSALSMK